MLARTIAKKGALNQIPSEPQCVPISPNNPVGFTDSLKLKLTYCEVSAGEQPIVRFLPTLKAAAMTFHTWVIVSASHGKLPPPHNRPATLQEFPLAIEAVVRVPPFLELDRRGRLWCHSFCFAKSCILFDWDIAGKYLQLCLSGKVKTLSFIHIMGFFKRRYFEQHTYRANV